MSQVPTEFTGCVSTALPGESVDLFARRTVSAVRVVPPRGAPSTSFGDDWEIEVRSTAEGRYGSAMTTAPTPNGLRDCLAVAREMRRLAPKRSPEIAALPTLPHTARGAGAFSTDEWDVDRALESVAGAGATVTFARSVTDVWLVESGGRTGSYSREESQVVIRAASGAVGATLARSRSELDVDGSLREYRQALHDFSMPPAAGEDPGWLILAPLATAQLLSHLALGLCRAPGTVGNPGREDRPVGSQHVTIIDDGTLPGGPASVPFDDEGVPSRRTEVIRAGRMSTFLSGLPLATSTGNAARRGWDRGITVAPTNLFLKPTTCDATIPPPVAGSGMYVRQLSGPRRPVLDLHASPMHLTAHGVAMRDGRPTGRTRAVISATASEVLNAVARVTGQPRFYRVNGVFGGSECLLVGLSARSVGC